MTSWKRTACALLLFGSAFGYLEAAVVAYLRLLHEPARLHYYPKRPPSELFPLLTLDQLRAAGGNQPRVLAIEIGREAATLLMLATVALAVSRNASQWAAAFCISFGAWDSTFYLFLKLLLGWPASLLTWDILFLIPVPWAGPVAAPILVSAAMIAGGIVQLWSESRPHPIRIAPLHWVGILAGAAIIIFSLAMDYRNLLAGGLPHPFNWPIFAAGMLLGIASYAQAARKSLRPSRPARQ